MPRVYYGLLAHDPPISQRIIASSRCQLPVEMLVVVVVVVVVVTQCECIRFLR